MSYPQQPYSTQGPYEQQYQAPPPGYAPPVGVHYQQSAQAQPRRRKRRIFLWVFLAVQALFVIWFVTGLAAKSPGPSVASQTAQVCANGGWQGLFKSYSDCMKHYAVGLRDAGDAGKAIGAGLIILFWMVVDVILGVSYGVYKLATRGRQALA